MSKMQASIVVGCDAETAMEAWREFDFRQVIGAGLTPAGQVVESDEDRVGGEESVRIEDRGDGSSLVTLTLEYDEDEAGDDLTVLRADVEDELARYRESIERRAA